MKYRILLPLAAIILMVSVILNSDIGPDYSSAWKPTYSDQPKAWFAANINDFSSASSALVLSGVQGNVLYSPAGAYLSLSVLYECTEGQTQEEILTLLQSAEAGDQREISAALLQSMHAHYNQIPSYLRLRLTEEELAGIPDDMAAALGLNAEQGAEPAKGIPVISAANALFAAEFTMLADGVAEVLQEHYNTQLNLSVNLTSTAGIDNWVGQSTDGLVPGLDQPLDDNTAAVILSTISFCDLWNTPFEQSLTKQANFQRSQGGKVKCDFMVHYSKPDEYAYLLADNYTILPWKFQNNHTMHFILPRKGLTPDDLLADPAFFSTALDYSEENPALRTNRLKLHVEIPKLNFSNTLPLADVLQAMGMESAFVPSGAELLLQGQDGTPAYVAAVQQQSLLELDEEGARALSFTLIDSRLLGGSLYSEKPTRLDFILDRPFLFAITAPEGYILFTGVVNDPTLLEQPEPES